MSVMTAYWFFNFLAWLISVVYFYKQSRKNSLSKALVLNTAVLTLILALIAAHLITAVLHPWLFNNWQNYFFSIQGWQSGFTSFGVVSGVITALFLASKLHKVSFSLIADISAPCIFIASMIGRVGCFFKGCCYGGPSSLPWAVRFNDLPFKSHPVQLYESVLSLMIILLLPWLKRLPWAKPGKGIFICLCLLLYFFERILLEFFRLGGTSKILFFGFSRTILLSLIGSLLCISYIVSVLPKTKT